jgi:two-component system cell cycle response regulator
MADHVSLSTVAGAPWQECPETVAGERILVVEDDPEMADAVAAVLEEHGYGVERVDRGGEAIARATAAPPALLILDLGLPDRDGTSVARELGEDRRTAETPLLFLSGNPDLAARVRGFRDRPMDFLHKPYRAEELLVRVERCLAEAEARARLISDARTDELTGLGNPRLLAERLQVETARHQRYGTPLTVVFLDVDGLKRVNDAHGHLAGSELLRAVGHALRAEIRETDVAFRYGGDEFVALLPHAERGNGLAFADRLLGRVRALRPCGVPVSVSIGVAASSQRGENAALTLLARADAAAYEAKRAGGNRVVGAP